MFLLRRSAVPSGDGEGSTSTATAAFSTTTPSLTVVAGGQVTTVAVDIWAAVGGPITSHAAGTVVYSVGSGWVTATFGLQPSGRFGVTLAVDPATLTPGSPTATVPIQLGNTSPGSTDLTLTVNVAPAPGAPATWPAPPAYYNPPVGLTFNPTTGRFEGTCITTPFVEPVTSENFTDTGSPTTNCANVQATLNAWAAAGERKTLIIPAGTILRGNLVLPANAASGWACLEVASYTLPDVAPSSSTGLFVVESPNVNPAVASTTSGGVTTTHGRYAFRGCEFRFISTLVTTGADTGPSTIVRFGAFSGQTTLSRVPDGYYLEGCWVHGWPTKHCRRGVEWHCSNLHMYRTRIDEIHNKSDGAGSDSQCVWGWNGPGPLFMDECPMSGGDECAGSGGAVPLISGVVPSDQHYRRCHTDKPASMLADGWKTKNHMEWKFARRVLVEECLHTGLPTWYDNGQQTVYGLKVQLNGSFAWAAFDDFLSYNCACDRVPQLAYYVVDPTFTLRRMAIVNFVGTNMNEAGDRATGPNAIMLAWNSGPVEDSHFDHITLVTDTGATADGALRMFGAGVNLALKNCLVECNSTAPTGAGGIWSSNGQGSVVLAARITGTVDIDAVHFIGSGPVGTEPSQLAGYPTGVMGYTSYADVGFRDVGAHDYGLGVTSPARGAATDGFDIGVHDYDAHKARIDTVPA